MLGEIGGDMRGGKVRKLVEIINGGGGGETGFRKTGEMVGVMGLTVC